MPKKMLFALASLSFLSGCASVIEGNSQEVVIKTNPVGAKCTLMRNQLLIGQIFETPGSVYLKKTTDPLTVTCTKQGYLDQSYRIESTYPADNWIYILAGGPIGWGIDIATGGNNFYQIPEMINLQKK